MLISIFNISHEVNIMYRCFCCMASLEKVMTNHFKSLNTYFCYSNMMLSVKQL